MANPKKPPKTSDEKHWKLVRFHEGLEIYDEGDGGDDGSGGFGSLGTETISREDQAILDQHNTRQANHAKETKGLIIERTYQLKQGINNFGNADMQQEFNNGKSAHPLLADKAQFAGMEEIDNDNNQDRQMELELRHTPEPVSAPSPSPFQTPKNTR